MNDRAAARRQPCVTALKQSLLWLCLLVNSVSCSRDGGVASSTGDSVTASDSPSSDSPDSTDEASIAETLKSGLARANALARQGQFARADATLRALLPQAPEDPGLLELAGDVAAALGDAQRSLEHYRVASEQFNSPPIELMDKVGRQLMNLGRPYDSVAQLNRMVEAYPSDLQTRRDLAGLLGSLGMEHRAEVHLRYLTQRGEAGVNELVVLSDLTRPQADQAICSFALKATPKDLRPRYGLARQKCYENRWSEVVDELHAVWEHSPDYPEASALYGRALVETTEANTDSQRLLDWVSSTDDSVRERTQYWLAAGIWAEKHGRSEQAARAFWQAVALDENNGESLSRLASALAQLGRSRDASLAAQRAEALVAMRDDIDSLLFWRKNSQRSAVAIARSMDRLGRVWEAVVWARCALQMTQDPDEDAREVFDKLRGRLTSRSPWQLPDRVVCPQIDVSALKLPTWDSHARESPVPEPSFASPIQFVDQAAQRGLQHITAIDAKEDQSGLWIYQSGAGGVGVIDFDLDGWPDLYLTNCDGVPKEASSSTNRLYRNHGGRFRDVTDHARLPRLGLCPRCGRG